MLKRSIAVAVVVAATVACGSAGAASKGGTTITLHKTKYGKVLATSSGVTLYLYTPDPKGKSVCTASCASVWPPLLTKGKPSAGAGVKASLLGTTHRGSKLQVTYAGHPLYRYSGDTKAGQTNGQGYGGIWYVVDAAGKKVTAKQASSGGGGSGGYGNGGY